MYRHARVHMHAHAHTHTHAVTHTHTHSCCHTHTHTHTHTHSCCLSIPGRLIALSLPRNYSGPSLREAPLCDSTIAMQAKWSLVNCNLVPGCLQWSGTDHFNVGFFCVAKNQLLIDVHREEFNSVTFCTSVFPFFFFSLWVMYPNYTKHDNFFKHFTVCSRWYK